MKTSKWLCIVLIYNIKDQQTITSESITVDKNLWIGSLKYTPLLAANIRLLFVVVQRNKVDHSIIETLILEKKDHENAYDRIDHNLSDNLILVDYNATVELFSFINSRYSAERKIMITLGHGSVFGMNYFDLYLPTGIKKSLLNHTTDIRQLDNFFSGIGEDKIENGYLKAIDKIDHKAGFELISSRQLISGNGDSKKYQLSNKELSQALKAFSKIEGGKHIDILVINNCFMQNIFAQYDYCDAVEYYVAPISGISYPGYNFLEILKNINDNPDVSIEKTAISFVSKEMIENHALYKKPRDNDFSKTAIDNRWFLQCVKLDDAMFANFKQQFASYINELYRIAKASRIMRLFVLDAFYSCYKYSEKSLPNLDLVDFRSFVFSLQDLVVRGNHGRIQEIDELLQFSKEILETITQLKFENYCGKDFLVDWENFNDKYLAATKQEAVSKIGLGFYLSKNLPDDSPLCEMLHTDNPFKPALIEQTNYFDFLKLMADDL